MFCSCLDVSWFCMFLTNKAALKTSQKMQFKNLVNTLFPLYYGNVFLEMVSFWDPSQPSEILYIHIYTCSVQWKCFYISELGKALKVNRNSYFQKKEYSQGHPAHFKEIEEYSSKLDTVLLLVAISMVQNVFADMSGSSFVLMNPLCNMQCFVSLIFNPLFYLYNKRIKVVGLNVWHKDTEVIQ